MILCNMGRRQGKSYMLKCERINELQLRIELAKKLGLSYKQDEQELNRLTKELDKSISKK